MAQTSVDFLWRWWNDNPFASYEEGLEAYRKTKEMHKEDCINFSIAWENRRDDEDIKSKEDLYNKIYHK